MVARLYWVIVLGCVACSASAQAPTVSQTPAVAETGASSSCYSAMLLVDKDVATAAAVDPVETQRGMLQTRSFGAGAPPGVRLERLRVERVDRSALLRLEVRADEDQAKTTCDWAVDRALKQSRSLQQPAGEWLVEQRQRLERELQTNEEALAAFDREHLLLSVPPQELVAIEARRLEELEQAKRRGKPGLDAAIEAQKQRLLELDLTLIDRQRLARSVENARALLESVAERLAKSEMAEMLSPSLRLLDACATCASER